MKGVVGGTHLFSGHIRACKLQQSVRVCMRLTSSSSFYFYFYYYFEKEDRHANTIAQDTIDHLASFFCQVESLGGCTILNMYEYT